MPTRTKTLSVVHTDSELDKARSETAERGNALHPCTSSGGALQISCDLPERCNNHMQRMSQTSAMQRIKITIHLS